MDKQAFHLLEEYNRRANADMNRFIAGLSMDEWNRTLGGFFSSVHGLCSHIYIVDYNWLRRFRVIRPYKTLENEFFQEAYDFSELLFSSPGEYIAARQLLDNKIRDFIYEVTEEDLDQVLAYADSRGRQHNRNFGGCLLHVFNHQIHHRGMISLCLELLGRDNDYANLVNIL
ncbi:DinB family protein [Treponema sp. OttesenSCG-928-L16]|nr:DinB family protein [Treponema sp. OttesenSCG-928-L16]